jgi:O-antigen ligase
MILSWIRRENFQSDTQFWGMLNGWAMVFVVIAGMLGAKAWAFTFPLYVTVLIVTDQIRGGSISRLLNSSPLTLSAAVFLTYLLLSLAKVSSQPIVLAKGTLIVAFMMALCAGCSVVAKETKANVSRMTEGLWGAFLFGLCCLALGLLTTAGDNGGQSAPNLGKHFRFSFSETTRAITPVTMLLGPALLSIVGGIRSPWRAYLACTVVALAAVVVSISPHETSKLALVAWLVVMAIGYFSAGWARRLVLTVWLAACTLVVPVAFLAKGLDLQHSTWLQPSAQQRILIWHKYAQLVLEAPVLGHGLEASYFLRPEIKGISELPYDRLGKKPPSNLKPFRGVHPHNAYLQIWFELGAVGALLFASVGLAVIAHIKSLESDVQPLMYGTFVSVAAVLFSSYGVWQIWFIGLLGFVVLASATAIRATSRSPE